MVSSFLARVFPAYAEKISKKAFVLKYRLTFDFIAPAYVRLMKSPLSAGYPTRRLCWSDSVPSTLNPWRRLAKTGLGLAILPRSAARSLSRLVVSGIELRRTVYAYGVAWRQRTGATSAFP